MFDLDLKIASKLSDPILHLRKIGAATHFFDIMGRTIWSCFCIASKVVD